MNNNVKVILTIQGIAGSKLVRKESTKISYVIRKKWLHDFNPKKQRDGDKIIRKGNRYTINFDVIPCSKTIKLTQEAYEHMTSSFQPTWYYKKDWTKLSPEQRLKQHFDVICSENNGTSYIYNILED